MLNENLILEGTLLRLFDLENKDSSTIVNEWNETISRFQLNLKKIAGFSSDWALSYISRALVLTHDGCGSHLIDLSAEDSYSSMQEEIEKSMTLRKELSIGRVQKILFKYQRDLGGLEKKCPIQAMVRFLTHSSNFEFYNSNWKAINLTLKDIS